MTLFDFFEQAFDFVGDIFSDVSGGDIIEGVTKIVTSKQRADANRAATDRVAAGAQAQADAIREGNRLAQLRFDELAELGEPGITALRSVVASDPRRLTPGQELSLSDTRRDTINALNRSGLRGSGRAVLAGLRGVESDVRGRAVESNLSRRDAASRVLAGQSAAATTRSGEIDIATGRAVGEAANRTGELAGATDFANANLRGQTLGDVAAIISSEDKSKGRSSKFKTRDEDDDDDSTAVGLGGRV